MWSGTAAASFRGVRRTPAGVPLPDAVIAVALLAVRYAPLATGLQPGGGAISYVTTPFWTLPLAWRRRYPLAVALTVAAADAVEVAVGRYHDPVPARRRVPGRRGGAGGGRRRRLPRLGPRAPGLAARPVLARCARGEPLA